MSENVEIYDNELKRKRVEAVFLAAIYSFYVGIILGLLMVFYAATVGF